MKLDDRDLDILDLIQSDARLPQAEIGRQVGLSAAAVCERLKKLEQQGVIQGYTARLDPTHVGCDITAFVEVFIEHPRHEKGFLDSVLGISEIQECHHVTGEFSCLLKIKVPSRRVLKNVLLDQINALPGVRQTRTMIALETNKEDYRIPLRAGEPAGAEEEVGT